MRLEGEVVDVIYVNNETGYTIVNVFTNIEIITCVGYFPDLYEGERVVVDGDFIQDPKYGEQFKVEKCACLLPDEEEDMVRYLASGLFRGIKDVTAKKIVSKFGKRTFEVLSTNPQELSQVRGISYDRAVELVDRFNNLIFLKNLIIELQAHELSINTILKLYKAYGDDT